jgi:hypothetical protein
MTRPTRTKAVGVANRVLVKTARPCFNQTGGTLFYSWETPMPAKLTNEIITAAIEGFESQKIRIDEQISELKAMLTGGPAEAAATPEPTTRKRRRFSAAARKRMKGAQRRRWAKIRGESMPATAAATPEPPKSKRRISEEGMKRIVAATKKRWRLAKAAKAQAATAKKAATAKTKAAASKAVLATPAEKSGPAKKAAAKKATAKKMATAPAENATQAATH